jgi:foldase protein PrsA
MQAGQQLGYADAPVVLAEREQLYHKYAMDVVRKGGQDPEYMPSDSLISDYYERNIDRFTFKKPIYVQHIIVQDSLFGEFLRDQALSGVDFLGLAKQYYPGAEEIRVAAADLGYIGPGEMPENFYRAAWGTARGNVSHPVKTEWGYHIIKVIDRKNDKPLTEVKSLIIDALRIEHARELTDRWEKEILGRHRIEYHLEKLKRIELPPKARR